VTLDPVPEVDESAVDALVQSDHARKPCGDQLIGMGFVWRGWMDGCMKRYRAVELNAVHPRDR